MNRTVCLLVILLLAACPAACADSAPEKLARRLDLSALEEMAQDSAVPIPVRETIIGLLSGDWNRGESIAAWLREQARAALRGALGQAAALVMPMLALTLSGALVSEALRCGVERVCALTAAIESLVILGGTWTQAAQAARRASALAGAMAPVLATLVSASGGVGSSALLTPLAALSAQLCEQIVVCGTIPLCGCCAVLAVCPAFSRRYAFTGVRKLLLRVCNGTHAALITAFTGLLTVRGLLSGGADSVSMRTARYTVDSLLPVIGGEIADSLDLLVASARLVRSCVGLTGLLILGLLCAGPLLSIVGKLAALRICAAVAETLQAGPIGEVFTGMADAARSLLAALASAMMLFVLILGMAASMSLAVR